MNEPPNQSLQPALCQMSVSAVLRPGDCLDCCSGRNNYRKEINRGRCQLQSAVSQPFHLRPITLESVPPTLPGIIKVNFIQGERCRIILPAHPLHHALVFFVRGIAENCQQFLVTVDATAVLRRARPATVKAHWISFPWNSGKCANPSWKLKRLQTLWFDGIGRNNIKPVRERSRDEQSVTFGEETQEKASAG